MKLSSQDNVRSGYEAKKTCQKPFTPKKSTFKNYENLIGHSYRQNTQTTLFARQMKQSEATKATQNTSPSLPNKDTHMHTSLANQKTQYKASKTI